MIWNLQCNEYILGIHLHLMKSQSQNLRKSKRLQDISTPDFSTPDFTIMNLSTPDISMFY